MIKKLLLPAAVTGLLFFGCANKTQNIKPLSSKSIELLEKYGVNESALIKTKNGYLFVIPDAKGAAIYELDQNYNLKWKKTTPVLIDLVKYEVKDSKLYILGYDQKAQKPVLLTYNLSGKLLNKKYFGKKFDLAKDFTTLNKHVYVATTHYSKDNNSDIVIYSDNKTITLSTPNMDNVFFISQYNGNILVIGTTRGTDQDVLIALKTPDNKTLWANKIDLGMDETPESYKILKNGEIKLKVLSTDNMGAERDMTFIIDKNGKIKKVKKGVEFKELPIKLRT